MTGKTKTVDTYPLGKYGCTLGVHYSVENDYHTLTGVEINDPGVARVSLRKVFLRDDEILDLSEWLGVLTTVINSRAERRSE